MTSEESVFIIAEYADDYRYSIFSVAAIDDEGGGGSCRAWCEADVDGWCEIRHNTER